MGASENPELAPMPRKKTPIYHGHKQPVRNRQQDAEEVLVSANLKVPLR